MSTFKIWANRVIRSRTMITAKLIAVLGVVQANSDFLSTVLTPAQFGWLMLAIAVVMAILRMDTHQSLHDK